MKRRLLRLVPYVFYALLAAFLVVYLTTIDFTRILEVRFDWLMLVLATVIGLVYRYWMVYIWLTILRSLGAGSFTDIPALNLVYAKSWLGRYIPGTAPWLLGKIYFASKQGLSKSKLAVSSFLEGGLQVLVLLITGLVLMAVDARAALIDPALTWGMIALAAVGTIALWPRVFNAVARWGYRLTRRGELSANDLPSWGTVGRGASLYLIGSILSGLSMFLVAKAVWPELSFASLLFVIGAGNLASAASMVAVFAPSGLGVREALLVILLGLVMPTEIALVAAVVLRLWSIVADLLFFGAAQAHVALRRRRPPRTASENP